MRSNKIRKINYGIKCSLIMLVAVFSINHIDNSPVVVSNGNLNKTLNLTAMAKKVKEDQYNNLYSAKDSFVGDLTGYGADCALCTGKLACMHTYDISNTDRYNDATYGNVRIVASSSNLTCGSIIRFEVDKISTEPTIAIVLDRGVLGTDLDLLTESEEYAGNYVGRQQIKYDVLRKGWGEK